MHSSEDSEAEELEDFVVSVAVDLLPVEVFAGEVVFPLVLVPLLVDDLLPLELFPPEVLLAVVFEPDDPVGVGVPVTFPPGNSTEIGPRDPVFVAVPVPLLVPVSVPSLAEREIGGLENEGTTGTNDLVIHGSPTMRPFRDVRGGDVVEGEAWPDSAGVGPSLGRCVVCASGLWAVDEALGASEDLFCSEPDATVDEAGAFELCGEAEEAEL